MSNRITRSMALMLALLLAVLFFSASPASASTRLHADTQAGIAAERQSHPVWINHGVVSAEYNTPQAELPMALRSSSQCLPQGQSPSYLYCAWTGAGYTGTFYSWNTWYNRACVPTSGAMNDSITSFWNQMPQYTAMMYIDGGCQNPPGWGGQLVFYSGSSSSNIRCTATGCWQFDNAISSFKTY